MCANALLGRCPRCETAITEGWAIIAYESKTGRRVYAECPDCRYIAHPIPERESP